MTARWLSRPVIRSVIASMTSSPWEEDTATAHMINSIVSSAEKAMEVMASASPPSNHS